MVTVAVVSPGAMGSALASALARGGAQVLATVSGRSERTARLAARVSGLELTPDLRSLVSGCDAILSIVPPEAAEPVGLQLAEAARTASAQPLIADLNAIAPATAERLEAIVSESRCEFVDGSISGPPPWQPGTTRVYLSGERAPDVAALPFAGVETIVVSERVGAASAVKMSTASVYKGSTAVLAQAILAAGANGVLEHVLADLRLGAPELVSRVERRLASAAAKSGRYVAEMREIASSQAAVGLTPALYEAMAEVYAAFAETPLAAAHPEDLPQDLELADVLARLARRET